MNRKELQALFRLRLLEAKALLHAGRPDGAYYLAGYAIECGLKACIAKETQRHEFPEKKRVDASYTHKIRELVRVAQLRADLETAFESGPLFQEYWDIGELWTEQSRYGKHSQKSARELIGAISDRNQGVIKWLRHYW